MSEEEKVADRPPLTDALTDVFVDGSNEYGQVRKSANPYEQGTAEHFYWAEGWQAAFDEDMRQTAD